jgi:hypothetical protein
MNCANGCSPNREHAADPKAAPANTLYRRTDHPVSQCRAILGVMPCVPDMKANGDDRTSL